MQVPRKALQFFYLWESCIYSGLYLTIEAVEKELVTMGFCGKKTRNVDIGLECLGCTDHKDRLEPSKREKTPLKKVRIAHGRQRAFEKKLDREKKNILSKAIDEYSEDGSQGQIRNSNRDSDKGKDSDKTKSASKSN